MGKGFIVRKGGGGKQALAPTITFVSKTETQIVFTIKNNDTSTAVILWEIGDTTPDANSFELAADTTSSNITVTGLTQGTEYIVYATANVTGKIKSNVSELSITTDSPPVYTAATGGTTEEYDDGGKRYRSHTFNSSGTFTVTTAGNGDRNQVDYLIIAGGGGGSNNQGGGGGAGGYRTTFGTQGGLGTLDTKPTVTTTSYSVTIGGGGSADNPGINGNNSSALGVTSTGGGGGGTGGSNAIAVAPSGGSGGGGGGGIVDFGNNISTTGGAGVSNQGFKGGDSPSSSSNKGTAGGGGAGQVGANNSGANGGNGGNGVSSIIRTGSSETRGGGGGGGTVTNGSTQSLGGTGGGGRGRNQFTAGTAGTANTGGGGGGGANGVNGVAYAGGSGIVIIRYEIAPTT
jgi:hypothetical protein